MRGTELWVTVQGTATDHRGGTLRGVSELPPASIDPGVAYEFLAWQILILTNDGLVGFRRVGGADGGTLVPDLATSIPRPTDGGRTYTFRLRTGIRYSTGETVVAGDIRRAIERSFGLEGSPAPFFYGGIVGGEACTARPADCDLSEGIATDDQPGTVTFHLVKADPEFLYKLALPFAAALPPGIPDEEAVEPLPATGPYMIESADERGLVLVRNPNFREWSTAAQPDGNPDRIELSYPFEPEALVDAVSSGEADILYVPFGSPPRIEELIVRYPAQIHFRTIPLTHWVSLNTRVPPFDDVRVRRALSLALDREELVRLSGVPAVPTCQMLPPNFPGYEPYCPYTVDPDPSGRWTGPDLERARELVVQSGTAGMPVTVWAPTFDNRIAQAAPHVVEVLEDLGYPAELKLEQDSDAFLSILLDSSLRNQAVVAGWIADYPSAHNFMFTLTCDSSVPNDPVANFNSTGFCDPKVDAMIEEALAVEAVTPDRAGPLWAEVDRAVTDQVPYVPMFNPAAVDFVSARIGGYQYNPQWGMLLGQLWVR